LLTPLMPFADENVIVVHHGHASRHSLSAANASSASSRSPRCSSLSNLRQTISERAGEVMEAGVAIRSGIRR
jgi:hypothetical protein